MSKHKTHNRGRYNNTLEIKDLEEDMILRRGYTDFMVDFVGRTSVTLLNLKTGEYDRISNRYGKIYGFSIL